MMPGSCICPVTVGHHRPGQCSGLQGSRQRGRGEVRGPPVSSSWSPALYCAFHLSIRLVEIKMVFEDLHGQTLQNRLSSIRSPMKVMANAPIRVVETGNCWPARRLSHLR